MLFMLILIGSLIALVVFAFVISRKVEFGEARFDSETGKVKAKDHPAQTGQAVPARRIETIDTDERNK